MFCWGCWWSLRLFFYPRAWLLWGLGKLGWVAVVLRLVSWVDGVGWVLICGYWSRIGIWFELLLYFIDQPYQYIWLQGLRPIINLCFFISFAVILFFLLVIHSHQLFLISFLISLFTIFIILIGQFFSIFISLIMILIQFLLFFCYKLHILLKSLFLFLKD